MYWGSTWPQQPRGPPLFRKQLRVWFSSLFLLCLSFIHLLFDFRLLSISLLLLFFPCTLSLRSLSTTLTFSPFLLPGLRLFIFSQSFSIHILSPLICSCLPWCPLSCSPLSRFSLLSFSSLILLSSFIHLSFSLSVFCLSLSLDLLSFSLSLGLLSLPPSLSFDYPLSLPALSLSTLIIHSLYLLFLSYFSSFSPLLFPLFPPLYPRGLPPSPLSSCRPLCPGE